MIGLLFSKQFVKFAFVGGFAALINWLTRVVLGYWITYSQAILIAYGVGMATAFVLNSYYVFPNSIKSRNIQARDFFIVNLAFLPIVWGLSVALELLFLSFGILNYAQALSHGIAVATPAVLNFFIYKFIAFKDEVYGKK